MDTFLKSLQAGSTHVEDENSLIADVLIAPDLSKYGMFDSRKKQRDELIKLGYKETLRTIKKRHYNFKKYYMK